MLDTVAMKTTQAKQSPHRVNGRRKGGNAAASAGSGDQSCHAKTGLHVMYYKVRGLMMGGGKQGQGFGFDGGHMAIRPPACLLSTPLQVLSMLFSW